ncbi:hypothetical protein LMG29542_02700 [Paraburkholderia humisilvae]|uniref:Uncharacterized protein n=1 Tax=Paraburkholderia humisilvae TaxID=627669 RepID=A0A6J5DP61_9BURK|nr:hypothetical protein LMG29542_02700 [Paraburkholderia humisilvae]
MTAIGNDTATIRISNCNAPADGRNAIELGQFVNNDAATAGRLHKVKVSARNDLADGLDIRSGRLDVRVITMLFTRGLDRDRVAGLECSDAFRYRGARHALPQSGQLGFFHSPFVSLPNYLDDLVHPLL